MATEQKTKDQETRHNTDSHKHKNGKRIKLEYRTMAINPNSNPELHEEEWELLASPHGDEEGEEDEQEANEIEQDEKGEEENNEDKDIEDNNTSSSHDIIETASSVTDSNMKDIVMEEGPPIDETTKEESATATADNFSTEAKEEVLEAGDADPASHSEKAELLDLTTIKDVTQIVEVCSDAEKYRSILRSLRQNPTHRDRVLVFVETNQGCDKLTQSLRVDGFVARAMHEGKSQGEREFGLEEIESCQSSMLIATDAGVRGLNVDSIQMVINFDMPSTVEDYVHRIGCAGRAGEKGIAVSFLVGEKNGLLARDLSDMLERTNQIVPPELVKLKEAQLSKHKLLVDMGFSEEKARTALLVSRGNVELAANSLLSDAAAPSTQQDSSNGGEEMTPFLKENDKPRGKQSSPPQHLADEAPKEANRASSAPNANANNDSEGGSGGGILGSSLRFIGNVVKDIDDQLHIRRKTRNSIKDIQNAVKDFDDQHHIRRKTRNSWKTVREQSQRGVQQVGDGAKMVGQKVKSLNEDHKLAEAVAAVAVVTGGVLLAKGNRGAGAAVLATGGAAYVASETMKAAPYRHNSGLNEELHLD